jgi:hypothetical protein
MADEAAKPDGGFLRRSYRVEGLLLTAAKGRRFPLLRVSAAPCCGQNDRHQ